MTAIEAYRKEIQERLEEYQERVLAHLLPQTGQPDEGSRADDPREGRCGLITESGTKVRRASSCGERA